MKKPNLIVDKSFQFALQIIALYKELQKEKEFVLSKQLLRSGTSIGANVHEATAGFSKKDFIHKMTISLKEAHESLYWLKLIKESQIVRINVDTQIQEADRLVSILTAIIKTARQNSK